MDNDDPAADYMALVDAVVLESAGTLSTLGAGILVAAHREIATDSRTFARLFDIAHALVLREITALEGNNMIAVRFRDGRTQRTQITLKDTAATLMRTASIGTGQTPS